MKLWVDDVRPAPEGYLWVRSVNGAKASIETVDEMLADLSAQKNIFYSHHPERQTTRMKEIQENIDNVTIEIIDIDHDAGDYANDGGDYIKLLDWLEETGRSYPIRIHSMNPVGVENMRRIIERNGWTEVI